MLTIDSVRLSPLQLDVLWEALDLGEPPYPLDITSHGAARSERAALRRDAMAELTEARLADRGQVDPVLAAALGLLARASYSIDSVWVAGSGESRLVRMLGAVGDGRAVLATQLTAADGDRGGDLMLNRIQEPGLVAEIIGALPEELPGGASAQSLPASVFAGRRLGPNTGGILRGVDDGYGREDRARRAMAELLDAPHVRSGQFAANARDRRGNKRRSSVVFWFDNANDGRYAAVVRPNGAGQNWVTVTPAAPDRLASRLRESLDEIV